MAVNALVGSFCHNQNNVGMEGLNNELLPPSAYTAVVRLPTTASFLVFIAVEIVLFSKLERCSVAVLWSDSNSELYRVSFLQRVKLRDGSA